MSIKEFTSFFIMSFLWGISFLFIKVAGKNISPSSLVVGRLFFASVFMLIYGYLTRGSLKIILKKWRIFLILGTLNCSIPYFLTTWGLANIDVGLTAILGSTMPLFTILIEHFSKDGDRITKGRIIGVLLGLVGVIILIGPEAMKGIGKNFFSQLAIVLANFFSAWAAVYGSKLKGYDPVVITTGQTIVAFVTVLPFAVFNISTVWQIDTDSLLAVLGLGVLSTAIPYTMLFKLLPKVGAAKCSFVTYLMPIIAISMGVILLGERFVWKYVIAIIFILSGVAVVNFAKSPINSNFPSKGL